MKISFLILAWLISGTCLAKPVNLSKSELELYKDIIKMEMKGVHMDYYRQFPSAQNDQLCIAKMQEYQPQVEQLITKAKKIGNFNLNSAAIGLKNCLTCSNGAIADCEILDRALLDFWHHKADLDF